MAIEVQKMMTKDEAREAANLINRGLDNMRKSLLEFYEREGWKALEYDSWRECVVAEFGKSQGQLYQQLTAAKIERQISSREEMEPNLPKILPSLPAKPLLELKRLPEEQRAEAWQEAVSKAPDGKPTAKQVQDAVIKRPRIIGPSIA